MRNRHWPALVAVCVLATACAGTQTATDGTEGGSDRQAAYDEFARCLREQGANVGNPTLSPDGNVQLPPAEGAPLSSRGELSRAAAECQPILSARGFPPPGPIELSEEDLAELRRQAAEFAKCLRGEDIDWPDPRWEGGAIVNWGAGQVGIDLADAEVQRIGEQCSARTGFDPALAHAVRDEQP